MQKWIIPCNIKYYDVEGAFKKLKIIEWKQSNKKIEVDDIVYVYIGKPIAAKKYKCKVNKANLNVITIDDTEFVLNGQPFETFGNYMQLELLEEYSNDKYSLEVLREKGLKGNVQGPRRTDIL